MTIRRANHATWKAGVRSLPILMTFAGATSRLSVRAEPFGIKKIRAGAQWSGANGIPVATPIKSGGVDRYRIEVGEYTNYQFHPDLPPTRL